MTLAARDVNLMGELPPAVEQNAESYGVDAATYVSEGTGLSAYILSGPHTDRP